MHEPEFRRARSGFRLVAIFLIALMCIALPFVFLKTLREGDGDFEELRNRVIGGDYEQGIDQLQEFQRRYPDSPDASRAGLFIGKTYLALGELDRAEQEFESTINRYPDSLEAKKSKYKLALIYLLRGNFAEAQNAFGKLADNREGPLSFEARAMREFLNNPPPGFAAGRAELE